MKKTNRSIFGMDIFTSEEIPNGYMLLTRESTIRGWKMLLTFPILQFPEPESHLHYKCRMVKERISKLKQRIRRIVFPYYLIRIDEYEES